MKIHRLFPAIALSLGCLAAMTLPATAGQRYWNLYIRSDGEQMLCYVASQPVRWEGTFKKRGKPYFVITHRGAAMEISTSSGYPYQRGREVVADVDGRPFLLFSKGEIAWAYDAQADHELIEVMSKGKELHLSGTSLKGTTSKDEYPLEGFAQALGQMKDKCKP